jgi:nitrate/nitrite transporter NarK
MPDIEKDDSSSHVKYPSVDVNEVEHITSGQISSSSSQTSVDDDVGRHEYGGAKAYLTVFGAFLALFSTFGQMNSFGTYQTWYKAHQLHHLPPSTISWIGSLQLWVFFFSVCPVLFGGFLPADTRCSW